MGKINKRRIKMIKTWIVICDECGKEIDATKEHFYCRDGGELCEKCNEEVWVKYGDV